MQTHIYVVIFLLNLLVNLKLKENFKATNRKILLTLQASIIISARRKVCVCIEMCRIISLLNFLYLFTYQLIKYKLAKDKITAVRE